MFRKPGDLFVIVVRTKSCRNGSTQFSGYVFITGKLAKEDIHKVGKYSLQRDRISQFWCCGHQKTVLECLHFDQKTRLGETNCHNRGMPEKIGGF